MYTVDVSTEKGGVGKSTIALNLASGLARRGHRVLLLEADPQRSIGDNFLPSLDRGAPGAAEYFLAPLEEEGISAEAVRQQLPKPLPVPGDTFHLLHGNTRLRDVEFQKDHALYWRLQSALSYLDDQYDFCIIDNRGSLGPLMICTLVAADALIIPTEADLLSVQRITPLLQTVEVVRKRYNNPDLKILGIVFSKVDTRTVLSREVADELRRNFNGTVFDASIPMYARLRECIGHGKSIFAYDSDEKKHQLGTSAQVFEKFVDEFLRRISHDAH